MKPHPKIYIARHCKTYFNTENRLQGTIDISLSDDGCDQAINNIKNLENLGIEIIITSPLKRAYETAQIYAIQLGVELSIDARLRELDHGQWEGQVIDELLHNTQSRYKEWMNNPIIVPIPNGSETIYEAQKRIISALHELLAISEQKTFLLITHKHIRAILQCTLLGIDLNQFSGQINETVLPLEVTEDQIRRLMSSPILNSDADTIRQSRFEGCVSGALGGSQHSSDKR